jgi:murein L,D-transpeptidase YcbB/YkuD
VKVWKLCSAIALSAALSSPLAAQSPARHANAAPAADVPAPSVVTPAPAEQIEPVRDPLMAAVQAELRKRIDVPGDELEKSWLSEIAGFYGAPDSKPLWVYDGGYRTRGWEAVHAMRHADEYGLDPADFPVPEILTNTPALTEVAAAEVQVSLAVVRYAYYARGGRIDPTSLSLWLDRPKAPMIYAGEVLRPLADASDVNAALRAYQPQHPQFEQLRQAYLAARGGATPVITPIPSGPALKRGDRSADVALIRKRLGVESGSGDDTLVDRPLLAAVRTYMSEQGYGRKRVIDDEVRSALSRPVVAGGAKRKALLDKYVANMERWRWVPANFGDLHIWNNLPEFETRVVKAGNVIHQERIIIGQPNTQTPVFSDQMSHVIFHPEWGVPESIKIRDLLPRLRGGDYSVLQRRGMRIVGNSGREVSPSKFNWNKVDPRSVPIMQRSGPSNPLGELKFIFPNGHDVYMHDTPNKGLFSSKERTFSHGCIRVRNPTRFAEVVLGEVDGWTATDVKRQLAQDDTLKVDLKTQIPVHNTYFTLVVDESGAVRDLKDVYGHDKRVTDALNGKSLQQISAADPAMALKRENERLKKQVVVARKPAAPRFDPWGYPISRRQAPPPPSFLWFD